MTDNLDALFRVIPKGMRRPRRPKATTPAKSTGQGITPGKARQLLKRAAQKPPYTFTCDEA